ncbi:6903_t:CDS:2, partial [Dentiscutata heterogama]
STFANLHEDIIHNRFKEFEKSPRAEMISVSIRPYYGETATIIKENTALLQDIPITSRLGFADVVFPGDTRNEIYLRFLSGDFTQGRAATSRNIQITVEVKLDTGETTSFEYLFEPLAEVGFTLENGYAKLNMAGETIIPLPVLSLGG